MSVAAPFLADASGTLFISYKDWIIPAIKVSSLMLIPSLTLQVVFIFFIMAAVLLPLGAVILVFGMKVSPFSLTPSSLLAACPLLLPQAAV